MSKFNRRDFLKLTGGAAAMTSIGYSSFAIGGAKKKVVIVGGGIGGATAARYIKKADPSIDVTVIEPNKNYYTCFMSNEVLSGDRSIDSIRFGYAGLKKEGINIVHEIVNDIDPEARVVKTNGGNSFKYDRCIVSPGVAFKWDTIDGYDAKAAKSMPHAWKAGAQTTILRNQLKEMRDGGTVIIAAPPNPFRCPPGPYERASQIAHYFKQHKPKSKILILDPKEKFSKFGLFNAGWKKHYGYGTDNSMIEWINGSNGGAIEAVNAKTNTVTALVDEFKGDVVNIIPAQKAGTIASIAGLTNKSGWCPVDLKTFESKNHSNIHVIGDAAIQSPLPKSGYAANSEAKVCAASVVALLNGDSAPQPSFVNTCYSVIAPNDGISVAMVYDYSDGKINKVKGSGGLTPGYDKTTMEMREREVLYAHSWFKNITKDVFG